MKLKFKIGLGIAVVLIGALVFTLWNNHQSSLLARYNLEKQDIVGVVETLESLGRSETLVASIRPQELILEENGEKVSLSTDNKFYFSVAPYLTYTHECFNHSITTCQGELSKQWFDVTIIGDDQTIYYAGQIETQENGFFSLWLPADVQGTITIKQGELSVTSTFSTASDQATCRTDLQLQ